MFDGLFGFLFEKEIVEKALKEYMDLRIYGCFKISCKNCKYLTKVNEHLYTCKREQLMKILLPKYKQEVKRIDDLTKGNY